MTPGGADISCVQSPVGSTNPFESNNSLWITNMNEVTNKSFQLSMDQRISIELRYVFGIGIEFCLL